MTSEPGVAAGQPVAEAVRVVPAGKAAIPGRTGPVRPSGASVLRG